MVVGERLFSRILNIWLFFLGVVVVLINIRVFCRVVFFFWLFWDVLVLLFVNNDLFIGLIMRSFEEFWFVMDCEVEVCIILLGVVVYVINCFEVEEDLIGESWRLFCFILEIFVVEFFWDIWILVICRYCLNFIVFLLDCFCRLGFVFVFCFMLMFFVGWLVYVDMFVFILLILCKLFWEFFVVIEVFWLVFLFEKSYMLLRLNSFKRWFG